MYLSIFCNRVLIHYSSVLANSKSIYDVTKKGVLLLSAIYRPVASRLPNLQFFPKTLLNGSKIWFTADSNYRPVCWKMTTLLRVHPLNYVRGQGAGDFCPKIVSHLRLWEPRHGVSSISAPKKKSVAAPKKEPQLFRLFFEGAGNFESQLRLPALFYQKMGVEPLFRLLKVR